MSSIIFLDIDGVLNNTRTWGERRPMGPWRFGHFDPRCVQFLNTVVRYADAQIVLSSSWRQGSRSYWDDLRTHMVDQGVERGVIDRTPHASLCGSDGYRGREIEAWIKGNRDESCAGIEVQRFVIFDDDSDMEPYMGHHVKTDNRHGLDKQDVDRALKTLGVTQGASRPSSSRPLPP